MKKIKIVFYGASVTQQSTNRDGIKVGYVPNAIQLLFEKFGATQFDFHQMGYGSNHFNDAGFIKFNDVLAIKPDIIVMEWHSTGIGNFDPARYDFVIENLHKIGCKVISLILPLKRCVGKPERENIKQSRWYQRKGLIQINFYPLIGHEINLDACLRDEVHTNENGGIVYGEIVARIISDIFQGKLVESESGDEIEPVSDYKQAPLVSSFSLDGCDLNYSQSLVVKYQAKGAVQLFADSMIGPYSPVLDVKCGTVKQSISMWDQWCKYERRCLKPLTHPLRQTEGTVMVSISSESPAYTEHQYNFLQKTDLIDRKLKQLNKLFMVGGNILEIRFKKMKTDSKMKILIFANCHGSLYKDALNQADKDGRLDVEHVISYENINKYDEVKSKFSQCDILIIQPVANYNEFKLDSLKKILKPNCVVIRVPFVRFDGFWDVKDVRVLKKFTQPAVMFFPNIRHLNEVGDYLRGSNCSELDIKRRFDSAIAEFKSLEKQGDVKFIDFFMKNYKSLPLFRDSYHPTKIFYEFLSHQIVNLTKLHENSLFLYNFEIKINNNKEYGHFKPITNKVASVLGLQYDLNSYFVYTRYDYLTSILRYENDPDVNVVADLTKLKNVLDNAVTFAAKMQSAKLSNGSHNGVIDAANNVCVIDGMKKCAQIFVVTPSFNSQDTIARTIISVLSQYGDFELHYHIQDGGSTDGTVAIIQAWKDKIVNGLWPTPCNKIHFSFESKTDSGMYDAIAKAFSTFSSADDRDWLTWINADDFFYPGAFSLLSKINNNNLFSQSISWITGCASTNHGGLQATSADRVLSSQLISKGLADGKHWGYVQQEGTFFRKMLWEKIDKVDGFSKLKYAGDWNLWYQFSKHAEIYQYKFPLASFSIMDGQLSQVGRKEYDNEIEQIVPQKNRLQSLLALDVDNINSHYIGSAWRDGKLFVEKKSISNHFKYRMSEMIKAQENQVERAVPALVLGANSTHPQHCHGFVVHDKDWQYPAITEHYAYQKLRETGFPDSDTVYVGFPWATLIDLLNTKKPGSEALINVLNKLRVTIAGKSHIVTVCQHILMLNYQNIFAELGVTDIFWTHAVNGQTFFPKYPDVKIHPFPLYPVQAVELAEYDNNQRSCLFSFVGAKANKWYLTQSRTMIVDSLSDDPRGVVIAREQWHYNKIVYNHQIYGTADPKSELVDNNAAQEFKKILLKSVFSLCPSGSGPNSIRLWESIGYGAIPVILADTYLPPGNLELWKQAAVFCDETELAIRALPDRLEKMANDPKLLASKRQAMRQLWMMYGPDCFVYDIQKFFLAPPAKSVTVPIHWQDTFIDAMVAAVLRSKGAEVATTRLFLLGCNSRILATPAYFAELYLQNRHLREAYQLAIQQAPAEIVQQINISSKLKNVALSN